MEWIKIEDQPVPKEGKFLVFYHGYMSVVEHLYEEDDGKPCFFDGGSVIHHVSHWMPLPQKPE